MRNIHGDDVHSDHPDLQHLCTCDLDADVEDLLGWDKIVALGSAVGAWWGGAPKEHATPKQVMELQQAQNTRDHEKVEVAVAMKEVLDTVDQTAQKGPNGRTVTLTDEQFKILTKDQRLRVKILTMETSLLLKKHPTTYECTSEDCTAAAAAANFAQLSGDAQEYGRHRPSRRLTEAQEINLKRLLQDTSSYSAWVGNIIETMNPWSQSDTNSKIKEAISTIDSRLPNAVRLAFEQSMHETGALAICLTQSDCIRPIKVAYESGDDRAIKKVFEDNEILISKPGVKRIVDFIVEEYSESKDINLAFDLAAGTTVDIMARDHNFADFDVKTQQGVIESALISNIPVNLRNEDFQQSVLSSLAQHTSLSHFKKHIITLTLNGIHNHYPRIPNDSMRLMRARAAERGGDGIIEQVGLIDGEVSKLLKSLYEEKDEEQRKTLLKKYSALRTEAMLHDAMQRGLNPNTGLGAGLGVTAGLLACSYFGPPGLAICAIYGTAGGVGGGSIGMWLSSTF